MENYDVAIIGAGPGGLACASRTEALGLSHLILEKGANIFQGIIDSYPRGKKVYPTIPKGEIGPFAVEALKPDDGNAPVEEYVAKIEAYARKCGMNIHFGEEFLEFKKESDRFRITTSIDQYLATTVVLSFGSNIPVELGVYGWAKTVARKLDNPDDHVGAPTLVLGGGNAAADVVSSLSKAKRAANDTTPIYWGNKMEHFKINKDVARDLGEEILLERKHSNLIFTAIQDGVKAAEHIGMSIDPSKREKTPIRVSSAATMPTAPVDY